MVKTVTAITCTGSRTQAFQLCRQYMARQTRKPDQWIVVHDSVDVTPELQEASAAEFELYAGPVRWQEGYNTHRSNMDEALKHVRGDVIVIFEDDDWYAPTYIEEMLKVLGNKLIAGEAYAKYYNVGLPGFKTMQNMFHSSLAQTVIHRDLLPELYRAVHSGQLYFDIHLWEEAFRNNIPRMLVSNKNISVGMKGLPGRHGIGAGHRAEGYKSDIDLNKLTEWIGEDVKNYLPFIKEIPRGKKLAVRKTVSAAQPGAGTAEQKLPARGPAGRAPKSPVPTKGQVPPIPTSPPGAKPTLQRPMRGWNVADKKPAGVPGS